MTMIYENENYLPAKVREAMFKNPELGVCVLVKNNTHGIWSANQHSATRQSKPHISAIVLNDRVSDFEHDFVIINKDGEICSTNCDAKIAVDEYGVVHVENDRFLVKSLEDAQTPQYVSAKNLDELNRKIKYLIKAKQVKRPAGFGQYGYPETSEKGGPSF